MFVLGAFGGVTFAASCNQVVMGGGGGSGTRNNGTGAQSSGGRGGGIVIMRIGSLGTAGNIDVSGGYGVDSDNDGGGGGGAGGSVVVAAATGNLNNLTVWAPGSAGANAWPTEPASGGANYHGPGGGGAGGQIFVSSAPGSFVVAGGAPGTTCNTPSSTYGATAGGAGTISTGVAMGCLPGVFAGASCAFTPTSTFSASPTVNGTFTRHSPPITVSPTITVTPNTCVNSYTGAALSGNVAVVTNCGGTGNNCVAASAASTNFPQSGNNTDGQADFTVTITTGGTYSFLATMYAPNPGTHNQGFVYLSNTTDTNGFGWDIHDVPTLGATWSGYITGEQGTGAAQGPRQWDLSPGTYTLVFQGTGRTPTSSAGRSSWWRPTLSRPPSARPAYHQPDVQQHEDRDRHSHALPSPIRPRPARRSTATSYLLSQLLR